MKRTVTVQLDHPTAERVERVARAKQQTLSAFLARAGEEAAHQALLDEAVTRYTQDPDNVSLSELAAETGLWIEEIMQEIWRRDRMTAAETGQTVEEVVRSQYRGSPEVAEAMFLAGCKTIADRGNDPELLRHAHEIVAARRAERQGHTSS